MGVVRKSQAVAFNAPADAQPFVRKRTESPAGVVGMVALVRQASARPITAGTAPPTGLLIRWSTQRSSGRHPEDAGGARTRSAEQRYRPEDVALELVRHECCGLVGRIGNIAQVRDDTAALSADIVIGKADVDGLRAVAR